MNTPCVHCVTSFLLTCPARGRWGDKLVSMAIDAVKRVRTVVDGRVEVDVKRYARVEKIPGGEMEDCKVGAVCP